LSHPSYRLPSPYEEVPLRRRASGLGMAIAINLLVVIIIIGLGTHVRFEQTSKGGIKVIDITNENQHDQRKRSAAAKPPPQMPRPKTHPPLVQPPIRLPAPPVTPPSPDTKVVEMSKADMQSVDQALAAPSNGSNNADDTEVVGTGPNGETLFAAEWYRRPTEQELSGYLPKNAMDGYGTIACKTYPNYRVDDCIAIESHPGNSHLASAVMNAAWQFKVRPPRKNGKPLIGSWVMIRITYTTRHE
jgi:protein TonB